MLYRGLFFLLLLFCVQAGALNPRITIPKDTTKDGSKNEKVFYGKASFYSDKFNGRKTSSGEIFSQKKFTAASNSLRLGTWIRVTNMENKKSVVVKVNDRMHPKNKRVLDLSKIAAQHLDFISSGTVKVKIEVVPAHTKN